MSQGNTNFKPSKHDEIPIYANSLPTDIEKYILMPYFGIVKLISPC